MYLPIFIAILLGLMSPSNSSSTNRRGNVYINVNQPKSEYSSFTDSIPPGNDGGTGGENGQLPPPRPKP